MSDQDRISPYNINTIYNPKPSLSRIRVCLSSLPEPVILYLWLLFSCRPKRILGLCYVVVKVRTGKKFRFALLITLGLVLLHSIEIFSNYILLDSLAGFIVNVGRDWIVSIGVWLVVRRMLTGESVKTNTLWLK